MIEFERHPLKIAHINVRTETHGEEEVMAVDLKLIFELPNTVLDFLSPSLRASLFEAANDPDLLTGADAPPLTCVKHPQLGVLRWSATWHAMRLDLHTGAQARGNLAFDGVTFGRLTLRPREGGFVACSARAQLHPQNENIAAKLLALLKHEVPATLDASEATDESDAGE